jgi:ribonuclease BN (tRNA processing enzyme)
VELIVMGAGPAYTDRLGATGSSYLVRVGREHLLLDLGQGSFACLAATIEPSSLAAVLISHLHPDHFIDLVPLRHYLKWEFRPSRRIRVLAPGGLADRLDALDGHPGFAAESLDVEAMPGAIEIGPFVVETRKIVHTDESYAFRVSTGRGPGLVYSGDCAVADELKPLIRPGDALLSEASFGAGPIADGAQHITSGDAARVAAEAGAARLWLTHLLSGFDRSATLSAAQGAFTGPVGLITEGDRFEI